MSQPIAGRLPLPPLRSLPMATTCCMTFSDCTTGTHQRQGPAVRHHDRGLLGLQYTHRLPDQPHGAVGRGGEGNGRAGAKGGPRADPMTTVRRPQARRKTQGCATVSQLAFRSQCFALVPVTRPSLSRWPSQPTAGPCCPESPCYHKIMHAASLQDSSRAWHSAAATQPTAVAGPVHAAVQECLPDLRLCTAQPVCGNPRSVRRNGDCVSCPLSHLCPRRRCPAPAATGSSTTLGSGCRCRSSWPSSPCPSVSYTSTSRHSTRGKQQPAGSRHAVPSGYWSVSGTQQVGVWVVTLSLDTNAAVVRGRVLRRRRRRRRCRGLRWWLAALGAFVRCNSKATYGYKWPRRRWVQSGGVQGAKGCGKWEARYAGWVVGVGISIARWELGSSLHGLVSEYVRALAIQCGVVVADNVRRLEPLIGICGCRCGARPRATGARSKRMIAMKHYDVLQREWHKHQGCATGLQHV